MFSELQATRNDKVSAATAWKLLPQYIACFQLLSLTIRREPMLAAADCINFEDMLGRKFYLSFQHYRHRAVCVRVCIKRASTKYLQTFEAFLSQQFRNVPGQRHVSEHQYRIMRNDAIIPEAEWAQSMELESNLKMSGLLLSWKTTGKRCPKPGCIGEGSRRSQTCFFKCSQCNLIYARDEGTQGFVEDLADLNEVNPHETELDDDEKHFRRIHVTWESSESAQEATATQQSQEEFAQSSTFANQATQPDQSSNIDIETRTTKLYSSLSASTVPSSSSGSGSTSRSSARRGYRSAGHKTSVIRSGGNRVIQHGVSGASKGSPTPSSHSSRDYYGPKGR